MAVTEKPALWPVLEEWRAHIQRAEEADVLPFHLVGCDALMARMGALAKKDALPGALAGVLEEHRPFAEDRAMASKWTSSMLEMAGQRERMLAEAAAAGTAVASLPVTPPGRGGRRRRWKTPWSWRTRSTTGFISTVSRARGRSSENRSTRSAARWCSTGMLRRCCRNGGRGKGARETGPLKTSRRASRRSRARPSPGRCRRTCPGPRTRSQSGSGKQKSCGGRKKSGDLRRGRPGTRTRPSKRWLGENAALPRCGRGTGREAGGLAGLAGPGRTGDGRGGEGGGGRGAG